MDDQIIRKGFGMRQDVAPELARDYDSEWMEKARKSDFRLDWPGLTVRIARELGFCYGVDRAIDYAYEARRKFPDRRLFITGEIIHNPRVNQRLREIGFQFLDGTYGSTVGFDEVVPQDVVLIPAFGVTTSLLERLKSKGCLLVDTTCGSVLNVWRRVEKYAREGFTCLIHGKFDHEETQATASRALMYPGGGYLVVRDMEETEEVAAFIERGGSSRAFGQRFGGAASPGFDPDRDLQRIGMANQTTMLSTESLAIAERLRQAMVKKFGEDEAAQRFRSFDTICSATQDRQDAVRALLQESLDLMLVLGGFNSSNTGHLTEICAERVPTYHIEEASHMLDFQRIFHKPAGASAAEVGENWLPVGDIAIGITAGASTPDREIGRVISRLLELRGLSE